MRTTRNMTFRDRLRAAIADSRRTQASIAREAGISTQRLNNYLSRGTTPELVVIDRLAAALGIEPDQLIRGSESFRTTLEATLARVLELDGQSPQRAAALARVTAEALKIQRGLPGEEEPELRARMAAQAAWHTRGGKAPPQ